MTTDENLTGPEPVRKLQTTLHAKAKEEPERLTSCHGDNRRRKRLGLMTWRVETLNETVDRELDALPADMQARFARIGRLIAAIGLERVGAPHVRHLNGPLWEIRLSGRDGIARALYIVAAGRRAVVARAFVKKTRRTPRREIEVALSRAREAMQ